MLFTFYHPECVNTGVDFNIQKSHRQPGIEGDKAMFQEPANSAKQVPDFFVFIHRFSLMEAHQNPNTGSGCLLSTQPKPSLKTASPHANGHSIAVVIFALGALGGRSFLRSSSACRFRSRLHWMEHVFWLE
ncbi:hypothetical protein LJC59_00165 [Desulfovibrio sp. OttesenSCG-928-A18]|nr:hypothetical protein [Desulfovibrio sp. OttesenSCG-928-A18]